MKTILNKQIAALLEESDITAALANVSACIAMSYENLNWAGFYYVKNNALVLGPFQGRPACTHIPFTKGVCGACYRTKQTQNIPAVLKLQNHIACDSASRSELCVPVIVNGEVVMEIDLDSPIEKRFTAVEITEMEATAEAIAKAFVQHDWHI